MTQFKRWTARRSVRMAAILLPIASIAGGFGGFLIAESAGAAGANAGAATIADPSTHAAMPLGGSATVWTITLPAQAACSHDSATGNTFVYGYIVPSSVDPGALTFTSTGPAQGFPLFTSGGSAHPYAAANTAVTTGQVVSIPNFNFNKFAANGTGAFNLPAGSYNVGLACWNTDTNTEDKYWNTTATFSASGTDPRGETWVTPAVVPTTTTEAPTTTVAPTTTTEAPTTTVVTTPPPPPCQPPAGLLSGPLWKLNESLHSLAALLCGLGL